MNQYILFALFALLAASAEGKKHVMSGKVTVNDRVENAQGVREISTEADLLMPVVPWEDLTADGVTVEVCTLHRIKFVGPVDEEDFQEGNVLTFPRDDHAALGCPEPPVKDELSVLDEVVFRKIVMVSNFNGGVHVKTRYVSGADVAPHVAVHVGELINPASRIIESGKSILEMKTVARVNDIGITAFDESGSIEVVSGVDLTWGIKATAGVCEFDFDRFPPKATWEQRVRVEASGSVSAAASFSNNQSGELLNVPILGAGFEKKIFLVGTIRFGLFASVDYDLSVMASASAVASFSGTYETGQKVEVSLTKFDTESLSASGEGGTGDLVFTGPTVDLDLSVEGFVGLRPAITADLSLPIIGDASAEVCATVGLQLDANYQDPAFPPTSGGLTLGTCDACHFVEGTLDLVGKDFTVEGKVPIFGSKTIVIDDLFLDENLGTVCAFETACPTVAPTTTAPVTTASSGTTVAPPTVATTVAVTTSTPATTATSAAPATTATTAAPATTATTAAPATTATTAAPATTATTAAPATTATTAAPATTATTAAPATTATTAAPATTATTVAPATTAMTAAPATTVTTVAPATTVSTATTTLATDVPSTTPPTTAAPATTTMLPTSCTAFGVAGTCVPTGECAALGSFSEAGLCPGPTDIQCCVPNFGDCFSEETGRAGTCTKSCDSGTVELGLCPGDASITCCLL